MTLQGGDRAREITNYCKMKVSTSKKAVNLLNNRYLFTFLCFKIM